MFVTGATLATASVFSQSVSTPPGGAVVTVMQKPGTPGAFAYFGSSFPRSPVFSGKFTAGSGVVLSDATAAWAVNQFNPALLSAPRTHYVEITTGAYQGLTVDIKATSPIALTVDFDFAAASLAGAGYHVRPHWTLAELFGANNTTGLKGGIPPAVDILSLWSGGAYTEYFYRIPPSGVAGWRKVGDDATDQAATLIYPEQGVFIKFHGNTGNQQVRIGEVQSGVLLIPVDPGFNLINPNLPVPLTLGSSGLYTGSSITGLKAGAPTTADIVSIWNGSAFDDYYLRMIGVTVQGWRKTGNISVDCANVPLPPGHAVVIRRKTDLPSFMWKRPSVY